MTRNMESTGEYETAQKFTEKLSFLSLLSSGDVRVFYTLPVSQISFELTVISTG